MYFWQTDLLAKDIMDGTVSNTTVKKYYIVLSAITIFSMYLGMAAGTEDVTSMWVECLIMFVITIIGINVTYETNGGEQGEDYIYRFVLLSVPITIKVFVAVFLAAFILGLSLEISGYSSSLDIVLLALTVAAQVWYFWRINVHLRSIVH